ncbi:hypothetical protein ACM714_27610 [Pseudomonas aeruginosa]|nr:hypothetical protein [Pseudomonas aeruginosa]HCL3292903.1 hypothetical protein [Pseudomonas aeruginosa]
MTAADKDNSAFVLDDRSIGAQLDAFRMYSQRIGYGTSDETGWPKRTNWAQVMLGFEAGAWDPDKGVAPVAGEVAWSFVREGLVQRYEAPEGADGQMPPERAFLLALLGLLETPQALLNQLPAQHRSLYYQQMLALKPRMAQADRVTVHFTLADGVREQMLPAGLQLDAGQDSAGTALRYALERPLAVNAARVTDLRWVVRDPCVPGGRRARVVLDETAGQLWPEGGVRLFEASPARVGEAPRADADRVVESGRIVESSVLAVAGGKRKWTVTFASASVGALRAAVSMGDAWVGVPCQKTDDNTWELTLAADGGVPGAVTSLDGLVSTAPLLRLISEAGEPVPEVTKLEVDVNGAVGVHCASDEGTALAEGGLPFGETADIGRGVNLISAEWWRLGPKLRQVTVTPKWLGLPSIPFPQWYGGDEKQKDNKWLLLDQDLNVVTDPAKGKTPDQLSKSYDVSTLAGRVTNGEAIAKEIVADPGYPNKPSKNSEFTARASLVRQDQAPATLADTLPLFAADHDDSAPQGQSLKVDLANLPVASAEAAVPDDEDPSKWPWRLRVELNTSFLHEAYALHEGAPPRSVLFLTEQKTKRMVAKTKEITGKGTVYEMIDTGIKVDPKSEATMYLPAMVEEEVCTVTPVSVALPKAQWHTPYVPQWAGLQVNYTAVDEQVSQRVMTPFGYAEQDDVLSQAAAQAEIYVGIDGIEAAQLLTLHWQLKSPSALPLEWQYLTAGERWARLPVNDETDAWRSAGGWSVDWPADANRTATSLPAGRMWLRGRARRLACRDAQQTALPTTPWLLGLVTNAVSAQLMAPQSVQGAHFETGLAALSVTQAIDAPSTLQEVAQPWPSSGGRAAETRVVFDARVARRLRHRERGLNNLDLTVLLHERYAGIRELTVLRPTRDEKGALKQTLVVMPDRMLSDSDDVRRPSLSAEHLHEMADWLKSSASPWLTLACVNPDYVSVSVSWAAEYAEGVSHSIGDARVRAALEAEFMPWAQASEDAARSVIGRGVSHEAVRDVLRRVAEVEKVNAVYLNGEPEQDPFIEPRQVVVLSCLPLEYTRLGLAWEGPLNSRFGELTLVGDGLARATVQVTLPKQVMGVGAEVIDTAGADVYLVDLETGQRLSESVSGGVGLWAKVSDGPVVWDRACYADPRGVAPVTDVTCLAFDVGTAPGTSGIHRVGMAVGLKVDGVPDVTLQSAVVEECVHLRVQAAARTTLWRSENRWNLISVTRRALQAPDGWEVTLERYGYGLKDGLERESLLRFAADERLSPTDMGKQTAGGVKGGGLRPIIAAFTPNAVVGGREASKSEVVLWYLEPTPGQLIGLDVGSAIGQAQMARAVSFVPEDHEDGRLALYALRLKTDKEPASGKKIGEVIESTSVSCPVMVYDAGARDGAANKVALTLATGAPTAAATPVEWTFAKPDELTPSITSIGPVTCAVKQHALRPAPEVIADLNFARVGTDQVSAEVLKSSTKMTSDGKGLVLLGSSALTSLRGAGTTIHLWWVDPEPGSTLGVKASESALGKIGLGTTDITFKVPARKPGQWAVYELQLISDASPTDDGSDRIGQKCEDDYYPASAKVSGWPSGVLTLTLNNLLNDAPSVAQVSS